MPVTQWEHDALPKRSPWARHYVPIDPHTRRPLHVGDQPVGCSEHGILACGTCNGTVEPWEPRPQAEGKRPKPLVTSAGIVIGPKRPAVTFRPLGHDCTGTVTVRHPEPQEHALGPWRTRRTPVAAPEPTVAPDPLTEAQAANRALAARLGITLPD